MRHPRKFLIACVALAAFSIFFPDAAFARRSCGGEPSAALTQPTCPMMKAQVAKAKSAGVRPVSCTRTVAHQEALRVYFTCMGRAGQASKVSRNSWHVHGCACDFSGKFSHTAGKWYTGRGHTGLHLSPDGR